MIDTELYKKQLEEELVVITKQLQSLGIHNPQVTSDWIALPQDGVQQEADDNLTADAAEAWMEANAVLATLETEYNNIVLALSKIEKGTYGICEISGEAIEEERLAADPGARTCMEHLGEEEDILK
jgi:RNA polymerase-binding transcription factor DksA